jgi:hypothetical protein
MVEVTEGERQPEAYVDESTAPKYGDDDQSDILDFRPQTKVGQSSLA